LLACDHARQKYSRYFEELKAKRTSCCCAVKKNSLGEVEQLTKKKKQMKMLKRLDISYIIIS